MYLTASRVSTDCGMGDTDSGNTCDKETDLLSDNSNKQLGSQVLVNKHQPEDSSLVADMSHQSRRVSELVANED